jgi:hypothetical protein
MARRSETNIRIPECAWDALYRIKEERGIKSRNETVRQILFEHLQVQEKADPGERLTHIATVLRYPPARQHRKHPRPGRQLRLRLDDGVADRARAVSLRLPGQERRAHHDYQARLLTDAVLTAIARVEPFSDDVLAGLKPLLRHRAALGLWHLTAATAITDAELEVRNDAHDAKVTLDDLTIDPTNEETDELHYALEVDAALDAEAWHTSDRFLVAANLARRHLTGPGADAYEQLLYSRGEEWNDELLEHRYADDKSALLAGVRPGFDWSGRGAAAVWRARRKVALAARWRSPPSSTGWSCAKQATRSTPWIRPVGRSAHQIPGVRCRCAMGSRASSRAGSRRGR